MAIWEDTTAMTCELIKTCFVTNAKAPQDGSNFTQNQSKQTSCQLILLWRVRGKDYIQYQICCDRSKSCCLTHPQQLCCRWKIWKTEKCLYQNRLSSQLSTGAGIHTHHHIHQPHSHTEHTQCVAGGQTVFRQIVLQFQTCYHQSCHFYKARVDGGSEDESVKQQ